MADHSHVPDDIAVRLAQRGGYGHLRDGIYGGIDGAVTTLAIVAGVAGAGLPMGVILALGLANVCADGFSMAAGNYSGTKADRDARLLLKKREARHIRDYPAGEREEIRQIFAAKGLTGDGLEAAVAAITSDRDVWIETMLTDEYGLAPVEPRPLHAALVTFGAFLVAGLVPLLPFLFALPHPFAASVLATSLTFFAIGAIKSLWSLSRWWVSGLETLAIGGLAATIAYVVGGLFHAGGGP